MLEGGCHCRSVRYEISGSPLFTCLCHCSDCRRHAGAPVVAWAMFTKDAVRLTKGAPKLYVSSEHGRRFFCPDCGTGLFFENAVTLPGITDVQIASLDQAEAVAPGKQIQLAEQLPWMDDVAALPRHDRYPGE